MKKVKDEDVGASTCKKVLEDLLTVQGQKKSHVHQNFITWGFLLAKILTIKHHHNNLKKKSWFSLTYQQACTEHIIRTCSLHQLHTMVPISS